MIETSFSAARVIASLKLWFLKVAIRCLGGDEDPFVDQWHTLYTLVGVDTSRGS